MIGITPTAPQCTARVPILKHSSDLKNAFTSRKPHSLRRLHHFTCNAASSIPDRAVIVLPGLGNNAADYNQLAATLNSAHNLHVEIAPVSRLDWARNAAGLLDAAYWRGTLKPRPTVDWYLERIASAIDAAQSAAPGLPMTLLAHSAGGWLGRLYMLENRQGIDRFVSLGSPHQPPPEGVIDQTRGILTWMSANCPGAYHSDVAYVTIAGKYIQGAPLGGPGSIQRRIVGQGYKQVCGDDAAWGDGITPVITSHLEGAFQVTLDGVYHSPLGAEEGSEEKIGKAKGEVGAALAEMSTAGTAEGSYYDSDEYEVSLKEVEAAAADEESVGPRVWYGSDGILEQWVHLLRESR